MTPGPHEHRAAPTPEAPLYAPPHRRLRSLLIALGIACAVIVASGAIWTAPARTDETDAWLFRYMGRQLNDGARLYTDIWDNKPPGIFWLNALSDMLFGRSAERSSVFCWAAAMAALASLFDLSHRLHGAAAAALSTCIFAVYAFDPMFHLGADRPSTFFVATEMAAACCLVRAWSADGLRRQRAWLLLAGVAAGAGLVFKQFVLALPIAFALASVTDALRHRSGSVLPHLVTFALGMLLTLGGTAVALALTSNLGAAWHAIFAFNAGVEMSRGVSWGWLMPSQLQPFAHAFFLPLLLAAATLAHDIWNVGRPSSPEPSAPCSRGPASSLFLALWGLTAFCLIAALPEERLTYYPLLFPPVGLLAARGVHLLFADGRRESRKLSYLSIFGLLWIVTVLGPKSLDAAGRWLRAIDERPGAETKRYADLVATVDAHAGPDATVFVWHYDPRVYWELDRPPAIAFLPTDKLTGDTPARVTLTRSVLNDVRAARPDVVILPEHEVRRALLRAAEQLSKEGSDSAPIHQPAETNTEAKNAAFAEFAQWLEAEYRLTGPAPLPSVWIRRP